MYDTSDPRSTLAKSSSAATPAAGAAADAEYGLFYKDPPTENDANGKTWLCRGQNFVVAYTQAKPGATFARDAQVDEYMVLAPDRDTPIRAEAGSQVETVAGYALLILPPGRSRITLPKGGTVIRLYTTRSADLAAKCANAASYANPHPNIPPLENWPAPPGGFRIRPYSLDVPKAPGRFGRIWRCTTLMVNVPDVNRGPRDLTKVSPHHHDDFEQGSLVLSGEWQHHIRWPWTVNMNQWREDVHLAVGAPSLTVIPPPAIHTSTWSAPGDNHLIDIFAPPRVDFSKNAGWVLNEAEYPLPPGRDELKRVVQDSVLEMPPRAGAGETLQGAVGARIDAITGWKVRYFAPLVLGLIMLGDSWDSILIAYVMPSLRAEWTLTPLQIGTIISAGFAGQFFGSLLLGPAAERFGRMPVFNVAIVVMCLLSVACALTLSREVFLALRFLEGVAIGGALPVCISYVNELAPTKTRGRYFSLFQFIMVSGYSLASIASAYIIPAFGWRAMFYLGAAPILLIPLVMLMLPESPRWLAKIGRVGAANRALARLGTAPVDEALPHERADAALRIPMLGLFAPAYRRRTIVVSILWFFASMVSFGLATWAPSLYVEVFHLKIEDALRYSALAGAIYLFVPLVFAAIIDRYGRRWPAILGAALSFACLVGLVLIDHTQTPLVVTLITTGWVAAASGSIILWPYSAEIFPTHIRSTGLGLASSLARGASMLTPLAVAGVLTATGSVRVVFGVLAICAAIVTLTWVLFTHETARKSLEELASG